MSAGGAFKAVERALTRHAAESDEKAARLRRLEVARLDRLLLGVWPRATKGDEKAARIALAVSKRRSELLGIDRRPRPEGEEGEPAGSAGNKELSSKEITAAMDETLQPLPFRAHRL